MPEATQYTVTMELPFHVLRTVQKLEDPIGDSTPDPVVIYKVRHNTPSREVIGAILEIREDERYMTLEPKEQVTTTLAAAVYAVISQAYPEATIKAIR